MQLLLIRHAIAEERTEFAATGKRDAERPLTAFGRRRMVRNARGLRRVVSRIDLIVSSPYVRARQTARIVADTLGMEAIALSEALAPDRHPKEILSWLAERDAGSAIAAVGHEPHLSRLLQWSMAQQTESHAVLRKGGVCLLEFEGAVRPGVAVLQWLLTPRQLRLIGQ
ncbi:MAG: hypothetical protein MNPFHGCM_02233 [Gemmatimonadaceae bacterium]|nr:hypothetical protein [Gemmatimonadaceae bacterium]